MIKYRPHRGGLAESMELYKEFDTVDQMFEHIVSQWHGFIDKDDLSYSEPMGNDDRIGWKEWRYVLTKRCGDDCYDIPQCIGMCAFTQEV